MKNLPYKIVIRGKITTIRFRNSGFDPGQCCQSYKIDSKFRNRNRYIYLSIGIVTFFGPKLEDILSITRPRVDNSIHYSIILTIKYVSIVLIIPC